jgi:hypothetical protein
MYGHAKNGKTMEKRVLVMKIPLLSIIPVFDVEASK